MQVIKHYFDIVCNNWKENYVYEYTLMFEGTNLRQPQYIECYDNIFKEAVISQIFENEPSIEEVSEHDLDTLINEKRAEILWNCRRAVDLDDYSTSEEYEDTEDSDDYTEIEY